MATGVDAFGRVDSVVANAAIGFYGGVLDYNKVNLGICDAAGDTVATSYVPSADDCQGAGNWYYEDTATGKNITLCEATCETVTAAGAKLFFNVGCTRIDDPDVE